MQLKTGNVDVGKLAVRDEAPGAKLCPTSL